MVEKERVADAADWRAQGGHMRTLAPIRSIANTTQGMDRNGPVHSDRSVWVGPFGLAFCPFGQHDQLK
jgi:hypothetical protein